MPKNINVSSRHRVNPLSLTPGGSTVTVIHENGTQLNYSNIKNPQAYIDKVVASDPTAIGFKVNGESVLVR